MLKGLDPLLSPDLLSALRAMGHGDEIAIVDANFPAASLGPPTLRCEGASATRLLDAVLSVMPLDDFAPQACWRMEVVGAPAQEQPIFEEFRRVIAAREGAGFSLASLERGAFYARAAEAFAILASGETRLYGNILLKKGVVRPEGDA